MDHLKCFTCRNSAGKGTLNIEDAAQCESCDTYYHLSCHKRAMQSRGPLKCCLEKEANAPISRGFLLGEFKSLREDMNKHHSEIVTRMDSMEVKLETRLENVEIQLTAHESQLKNHQSLLDTHGREITDVGEQIHLFKTEGDHWKSHVEESILSEVADRIRREANVFVYNLPQENNGDMSNIALLLQNFSTAPFSASDVKAAVRIKTKVPNKISPLKVTLSNKEFARWLFVHSKKGADPSVKCVPDRTATQKSNFSKVIAELNERKDRGESNIKLKYINGNPQIVEEKGSKNSRKTGQKDKQKS